MARKITRAEVLERAKKLWPGNTVPYSQSLIHKGTGYRQDCSGFLSMVWDIPPSEKGGWGGQSTVTLVTNGYIKEIPLNDLQPGDAVGICGPGTAADAGHIVLFERWLNQDPNNDDYYGIEQAGPNGRRGPSHRLITYPYSGMGGPWKAWRYVNIVEDGGVTVPNDAAYAPYEKPAVVEDRPLAVLQADVWYQIIAGTSPYAKDRPGYLIRKIHGLETELHDVNLKLDALIGLIEDGKVNP